MLCGPAQTIAGKYLPPDRALPLPLHRPSDAESLCRLIEGGHARAELFADLGEALLNRGERGLAYRAFDRALRMRRQDPAWTRRMQDRKYACGVRVPRATIEREEKEARLWVKAFVEYRSHGGRDPKEFYERFGRPEEDLALVVRARQAAWAGGVVGVLAGAVFLLGARWIRRRTALVPLCCALLCVAGALLLARTGPLWWGAFFSAAGAMATLLLGRRVGAPARRVHSRA